MTTIKTFVLTAALGLSSMAFASARTYNITLVNPTVAGTAKLSAGAYKLSVDGRIATFTNVSTNKSVLVVVRPGVAVHKGDNTTMDMTVQNGAERLNSIQFDDSSALEF